MTSVRPTDVFINRRGRKNVVVCRWLHYWRHLETDFIQMDDQLSVPSSVTWRADQCFLQQATFLVSGAHSSGTFRDNRWCWPRLLTTSMSSRWKAFFSQMQFLSSTEIHSKNHILRSPKVLSMSALLEPNETDLQDKFLLIFLFLITQHF